jgi:thiamine biosynthesis lipoprotein
MMHASKQDTLTIGRSIARVSAIVLLMLIAGCVRTEHTHSIVDSPSVQRTSKLHRYARICMGSRCTIVIEAHSEPEAARVAAAGFEEISRVEMVLSDYRPDSEAMLLVNQDPGVWHPVSDLLFDVLCRSRDIHIGTHGAFDPAIGAFTHLWRSQQMPTSAHIRAAGSRTGFAKLQLHSSDRSVRFDTPGMILDFGGIGKGYAAQRALDLIGEMGYPVAQVDMGGDLALGDPPSGQIAGWRIEIATGLGESRVEYLSNCAIATSGDLERFYEYNGTRYSHIIDPSTGYGITERRAATVIASDAALADALASAVSVAGSDGIGSIQMAYPDARIELITQAIVQE